MTFANSTISNLDNTNSIVNRLRSASHRKHRARTKQHLRELILDLHVRWKSPPTGDTKVDKTKPIIPQLHKIQSQSQIHRNVPHCPPSPTTKMPSKKAKKSRKDAQVRQKKKEKEAKKAKKPTTSSNPTIKSCLKRTTRATSKRQQQPVEIDDSDDSDDESKEEESSDEETDDEEEPIERPRPRNRTNVCYYKVKLYSNGGDNPNKVFQLLFRKWFTVMKRGVPSFVVYSYRDLANSDAIQNKTEITAKLQDFRKYFIGIKLKSTPGDVWFRIRCGFDDSPEDMRDATDWWFRENNGVFFKQPMQVPDTVRDIWLFMSHDRIDTTRLTEAIQDKAKEKSYPTAPFVLMFSAIRDGRKFDSAPRKHEKPIKAIHVECAVSDFLVIRKLFSTLYGHTATTYPLDIWMRYVLVPNQKQTTATREGILALRRRQADFPASIDHCTSSAITTLDRTVGTHGKTFREMIMQIKTKDDNERTVFLGINADKMTGEHVFTYALDIEQESRDMAVQFGSYLAHEYSAEVFKCMETTEAAEARDSPWDPDTHSAKSPEDESMKNLVEIVDGMGCLKSPQKVNDLQHSSPSLSKNVGFKFPTDTSSIKTFSSQEKRKRDVLQDDDEDDEDVDDEEDDDDDDDNDADSDANATDTSTAPNESDIELSSIESNTDNPDKDRKNARTDERKDRSPLSSDRNPPPDRAAGRT